MTLSEAEEELQRGGSPYGEDEFHEDDVKFPPPQPQMNLSQERFICLQSTNFFATMPSVLTYDLNNTRSYWSRYWSRNRESVPGIFVWVYFAFSSRHNPARRQKPLRQTKNKTRAQARIRIRNNRWHYSDHGRRSNGWVFGSHS